MTHTEQDSRTTLVAPGSKTRPDPKILKTQAAVERRFFWVGSMASAPAHSIAVAGVPFPKITHKIRKEHGETIRTERLGTIVALTRDQLRLLGERLPYKILRFQKKRFTDEPGSGAIIDVYHQILDDPEYRDNPGMQRPHRHAILGNGQPITIPSDKEIAAANANGFHLAHYEPREADEPVADYVYCVPAYDQKHPAPGSACPDPISVTGLVWPE